MTMNLQDKMELDDDGDYVLEMVHPNIHSGYLLIDIVVVDIAVVAKLLIQGQCYLLNAQEYYVAEYQRTMGAIEMSMWILANHQ